MPLIRHIVVTGQVWLTAVMTLVAGLPHFQCACPDGSTKPVCVEVASAAPGCCCDGACCGNHAAPGPQSQTIKAKSCCGHATGASAKSDRRHSMHGSGCSRSLAAFDQIAVAPEERTCADAGPALQVAALSDSAPALAPAVHTPTSWQTHLAAPPTDRVVTFLRLVI